MTANNLKVLFITHDSPSDPDAIRGDPLQLLAEALLRQGVTVRIAAPDPRTREQVSKFIQNARFRANEPTNVSGPALASKRSTRASSSREIRGTALGYLGTEFGSAVKLRRDFEPDIVHAHWWFPSGLVGSWVSSLASLPLVTSLHGYDPRRTIAGSPARPLFAHVLRRSAAVTVESSALIPGVARISGTPSPVVAPLPLSTELYKPAANKSDLVAVLPSNVRVHGPELVAFLRRLAATDSAIALLVEPLDVAWASSAREQLGSGDRVRVIPMLEHGEVARALGEARCCMTYHATERQRTILASAMLAGAAPILIDSGVLADLAGDESRVAFRVDSSDPKERFEHVLEILANPSALLERGEAARMYALATRAPDSCAGRMLGVYLRALGDAAA